MKHKSHTIEYGKHELTFETGVMAKQATGSVLVSLDDTVVLATVTADSNNTLDQNFLPLSVFYQEKTYAAGKIPGGYFRREGRPTEKEILTSRLIDRPMRPLFPKGFFNEVQIICNVLSLNLEMDADVVAMIAASAACTLAGMPTTSIMGACRVGLVDGENVLCPTKTQLATSTLDLVMAGTQSAVLMVESDAHELSEKQMLSSLEFGFEHIKKLTQEIDSFAKEVGVTPFEWTPPESSPDLYARVKKEYGSRVTSAYSITDKSKRKLELRSINEEAQSALVDEDATSENTVSSKHLADAFYDLEHDIVREKLLKEKSRIDGRKTDEVRELDIRVGVLPRTHGSALFTRGETQALVVSTLGTEQDAQRIDSLEGDQKDRFMLHYNFPPFSTGEVKRMMGPGRREIGHGKLAKRALHAVMPPVEKCPYTVRVVSEIMESNGSSSMATVCGASLSLLDAGITLKAPVAGIAMGLVKEGDDFVVLSDILGDEDHIGDMDFKVAGTEEGITALQMDIKIDGITFDIIDQALDQAKAGRLHILSHMNKVLSSPRTDVSEFAPRFITFKVNPDKIRDVIGKGGVTIRAITEQTGANINIEDDGTLTIASVDKKAGEDAKKKIMAIASDLEVGKLYTGTIAKIMEYGAFVTVVPGKDGLVHISQISEERVEDITTILKAGDQVNVKVLEIDKQGRVRLSMKGISQEPIVE